MCSSTDFSDFIPKKHANGGTISKYDKYLVDAATVLGAKMISEFYKNKEAGEYCDTELDTKTSAYFNDTWGAEVKVTARELRSQARAEKRKERVEKRKKQKAIKIEKRLGLDPYTITIDSPQPKDSYVVYTDPYTITIDSPQPKDSYVVIDSSGIVLSNRIKIDTLEVEYTEKEKIFDAEVLANREYTNRCGNALKRMQEIRAEINTLKNNDSKI